MTASLVVSNASALIAFAHISRLNLLQSVYATLTIPLEVAREVLPMGPLPYWISEMPVRLPIDSLNHVIGTVGVIVKAKRLGHLSEVTTCIGSSPVRRILFR